MKKQPEVLSEWVLERNLPSRLQLVIAAFVVANALGFTFVGAKFVALGWFINIPCGFAHYLLIEEPNDSGNPVGTAVICAIPWAQTVLTTPFIIWVTLWYLQMLLRAFGVLSEEDEG